jgi:hypothetical protein
MSRLIRSLVAAALVAVPLVVAELRPGIVRIEVILGVTIIAWAVDYFLILAPDERFARARSPSLNMVFKSNFRRQIKNLPSGLRLPFRVNVMEPCWIWGRRHLRITYDFEMRESDPDFGLNWPKGHGLCWEVFKNHRAGWYDRREHSPDRFMLTNVHRDATKDVVAVLCLPIHRKSNRRCCGVLNIDALSDEAADFLKEQKQKFVSNENRELLDVVRLVSLYV